MNKRPVGRPRKPDKKLPISVKLPPHIIKWLDSRKESRAVLIEEGVDILRKKRRIN